MLKIKDNVSLKELEKFGFEKADFNENYYIKYIPDDLNYFDNLGDINEKMPYYRTLYVDINTRRLFAYNDYIDKEIQLITEYIYDLIKAGLVEKVEDK